MKLSEVATINFSLTDWSAATNQGWLLLISEQYLPVPSIEKVTQKTRL